MNIYSVFSQDAIRLMKDDEDDNRNKNNNMNTGCFCVDTLNNYNNN